MTDDADDAAPPDEMKLGEEFEYSVDLPYGIGDADADADGSQVTVVATPSEDDAVVTVKKGNKVISEETTDGNNYLITIDAGDNTITMEVLAPDYATMKTYTLTINRAERNTSDDARLSSLSLSDGTLMPAFDPADLPTAVNATELNTGTTAEFAHPYEVRVPNSLESLTVMAEAMNSSAMVSITNNGSSVSGGAVALIVGVGGNEIDITVNAENRAAEKHYQVTVTRVVATASSNANLSDLMLQMPGVTLDPVFETDNLPALMGGAHHFSASVSRGSSDIRVLPVAHDTATVTVMSSTTDGVIDPDPEVDDADPPEYEVDLEVGDNVITVMVTAENVVTTKTYKITINRPGTGNTALSDLSLSGVSLNEPFGTAADDAYTADAADSIDSTTVTATPEQSNATVEIMPRDADSAMDGHQVALTPGSNTIIVTVTAGDNTREYTVTVTAEASSDATLQTLALSGLTLSPAFDPATTAYTAEVERLDMTTVVAMATHSGATVEGAVQRSLTVGENAIMVTVTAEDGETSQIYTVTVTVLMGSTLLERYDTNDNDKIDKSEAVAAIGDYIAGRITKADVVRVIGLYIAG